MEEPHAARSRLLRWAAIAVVGVASGGAAMTAWGGTSQAIGPLETRLSIVPSWAGGVTVGVPPLGRLDLRTHRGPLQVRATVTAIEPRRARALLRAPNPGRTVTSQVSADSQDGLAETAARSLLVALVAGGVTCGVVFRRPRAAVGGAAAVALVLSGSAAVAGLTLRTQALDEPRFDGLLAQAPALIGRVESFDQYSQRLAQLTANVARVYGRLATLPASPGEDTTRMLWVSDLHNNPAGFTVMRQLVEQFDVAAVLDTGDIVDVGSAVENRQLARIDSLGVPYVYVRGNHDSRGVTQAFIDGLAAGRVVDLGEVVDVQGLRITGIGDPLFRPNRTPDAEQAADVAQLQAAGKRLRAAIEAEPTPVDVVMVHNPKLAAELLGAVPLVLDGHTHERRDRTVDGTLELTQGSSGGAGLRTFDGEDALPLQMSVLHFDRAGSLLAVDDITVGGLGERSVTVERRTPESYGVRDASAD